MTLPTTKPKQPLKPGERALFAVFGAFLVLAVIGYIVLETVRSHMKEPMFTSLSSFDSTAEGLRGSELFREANCTACHRAMRNGTNNGIVLDGIGSRRSVEWIENFLRRPEATYGTPTMDHAPGREAGYTITLPPADIHDIAVFLSELKAEQGSSMAREPPPESSGFIDSMVKMWAPEGWKDKYQDIRTKPPGQEGRTTEKAPSP